MVVDGFNILINNINKFHTDNARCPVCKRDRRKKGVISPNTEVTRRCNICGEPMNWKTLDHSGIRVEYEWSVQEQRPIKLKSF